MNRRSQSAAKSEPSNRRTEKPAAANNEQPPAGSPKTAAEAEIALYRHALDKAREDFQAFAYSVSHDLRAPLRAIEGFSKILIEDYAGELSSEPQRFLKHIVSNAQQLGTQIEDLLKFYRLGKHLPSKALVDTNAICKEILAGLDGPSAKKILIHADEFPSVSADPGHLREIFSQLLTNSLKATAGSAHPKIEIGAKVEPRATTFYVRDNGVGFDTRGAARLFQVFQKLHSASDFPGNGIGLAIVKRLVEAQGGCVSASSEPGKGATFCFTLPHDDRPVALMPDCPAVTAAN